MRKSRFSEEQIIGILKEAEAGLSPSTLCRKHGISDATFYNWRKKYGGLEVSEAKRLKALEDENVRLKKLLIDHARRAFEPTLSDTLLQAWSADNTRYLETDLDHLSDVLNTPQVSYHYRLNYPVARLAAGWLFARGEGEWLVSLFASGESAMAQMPMEPMASKAADIENYLPPMPMATASGSVIDAYRSLGAMALLEIDGWKGESERPIGDYYANLLRHLQERTAFVALDDQQRPIGYATWIKPEHADRLTLTRQAAPFGDHLALQRLLERHIEQSGQVAARHFRSAQQEQEAW